MRVAKFLMAAAVATMAVAPAVAAPAHPAAVLSVSKSVRAGTPATKSNGLFGGGIVAILAIAAVVAGIVVVIDNNDDRPDSN